MPKRAVWRLLPCKSCAASSRCNSSGSPRNRALPSLRELNPRNFTEWRQTWKEKELARKKKFERVIGFFWFLRAAKLATRESHGNHGPGDREARSDGLLHGR